MSLSSEYKLLLQLLRLSIGTESNPQLPDNVDWQELIRLAGKQKVSALAFDGLTKSGYQIPDKALYDAWRNEVARSIQSYDYYVILLTTLCQIFASHNLRTIILKGYGLGLNYPNPSYRGAGDIDIFVVDENNNPATEQALDIIERQLNIKTRKVPHDYEFDFKGIIVELHYDTTNAYWNTRNEHYIVSRLTELLPHNLIEIDSIPGAYIPNATFNALYLTRHTLGHFYTASGNLRQYTDWVTFLTLHHDEIDWNTLQSELEKSNMKPYFDGLSTMLNHWLNLDTTHIPISTPNTLTEQYILRDMHHTVENGRHLHKRIHYYYSNRHKLHFISGKSWLSLLKDSIKATIIHQLHPSRPLY